MGRKGMRSQVREVRLLSTSKAPGCHRATGGGWREAQGAARLGHAEAQGSLLSPAHPPAGPPAHTADYSCSAFPEAGRQAVPALDLSWSRAPAQRTYIAK